MEMWEVVRRVLAQATGAQSFSASRVVLEYGREIKAAGQGAQLAEFVEAIARDMEAAGLIQSSGPIRPGLSIIDAKHRTELGEELFNWLGRQGIVQFFESMHADLDKGEIQRLLHQLKA